jgi:uncharacterized protein
MLVEKTIEYVRSVLGDEASGHDFDHCLRVYRLACRLAGDMQVNQFVVKLASLLHDVDDPKLDFNQSVDSRHKAEAFLASQNVDKDIISQVTDIISNMSYSSYVAGKRVHSLEGEIVQDADRLEALGAIGIARVFSYGGHKKRPLYAGRTDDSSSIAHFYDKLFKLPELMNTKKARKMADKRLKFMKKYLKEFYEEWRDAE